MTSPLNAILPPELSRFLNDVPTREIDGLQSIRYKVLRLIINHRGAESAIAIDIISEGTGYTARSIKAAVKALVETYGVPIGSSRHEPYGYFIIETEADREIALRPLRSEIVSLARRVKMLAGNSVLKKMFGDVQMELGFTLHAAGEKSPWYLCKFCSKAERENDDHAANSSMWHPFIPVGVCGKALGNHTVPSPSSEISFGRIFGTGTFEGSDLAYELVDCYCPLPEDHTLKQCIPYIGYERKDPA